MNRDGFSTSLWQSQIENYPQKVTRAPAEKFDVAIVGGGVTGLTLALHLQKAGRACIVIEAKNIGFGTTGGTTSHLNTYFEATFADTKKNFGAEGAELLAETGRESLAMIDDLVRTHAIDCGFVYRPSFLMAGDESQAKELVRTVESMREVGHVAEYTAEIPIARDFVKAAKIPNQAQLHPVLYLHGLAKAFESAGGVLLQNCRAMDAKEGDEIQIETSRGPITAKNLVYATHTPPGINILHMRMAPIRSYVLGVTLTDASKYPDALVYDLEDPYHYYRSQEVNGRKFMIIGGNDHKTAHEDSRACFADLEKHARENFPVAEIVYRWSSQLYESADQMPFIGHFPQHGANVFVATGFAGNGMMYGTIAARVIGDLILKGESKYTPLFNPDRIKPLTGLTTFVKDQMDVAKKMVTGWVAQEKLDGLAELPKGEGKVVRYEGHSVALYRDETGKVHAVNPTCPHMLCAVDFNRAEKSWDCPCHGSRFGIDGELITGPARHDLKPVELR